MTQKTKQNILELYDEALDKNKAIRDIAKMIGVSQEEVTDVIYEYGRPIPPKRTKSEPKKEPDDFDCPDDEAAAQEPEESQEAQEAADQLPIPNYIFEVLLREMDDLDAQINAMTQELADKSNKYTLISKFIKEYKRP